MTRLSFRRTNGNIHTPQGQYMATPWVEFQSHDGRAVDGKRVQWRLRPTQFTEPQSSLGATLLGSLEEVLAVGVLLESQVHTTNPERWAQASKVALDTKRPPRLSFLGAGNNRELVRLWSMLDLTNEQLRIAGLGPVGTFALVPGTPFMLVERFDGPALTWQTPSIQLTQFSGGPTQWAPSRPDVLGLPYSNKEDLIELATVLTAADKKAIGPLFTPANAQFPINSRIMDPAARRYVLDTLADLRSRGLGNTALVRNLTTLSPDMPRRNLTPEYQYLDRWPERSRLLYLLRLTDEGDKMVTAEPVDWLPRLGHLATYDETHRAYEIPMSEVAATEPVALHQALSVASVARFDSRAPHELGDQVLQRPPVVNRPAAAPTTPLRPAAAPTTPLRPAAAPTTPLRPAAASTTPLQHRGKRSSYTTVLLPDGSISSAPSVLTPTTVLDPEELSDRAERSADTDFDQNSPLRPFDQHAPTWPYVRGFLSRERLQGRWHHHATAGLDGTGLGLSGPLVFTPRGDFVVTPMRHTESLPDGGYRRSIRWEASSTEWGPLSHDVVAPMPIEALFARLLHVEASVHPKDFKDMATWVRAWPKAPYRYAPEIYRRFAFASTAEAQATWGLMRLTPEELSLASIGTLDQLRVIEGSPFLRVDGGEGIGLLWSMPSFSAVAPNDALRMDFTAMDGISLTNPKAAVRLAAILSEAVHRAARNGESFIVDRSSLEGHNGPNMLDY